MRRNHLLGTLAAGALLFAGGARGAEADNSVTHVVSRGAAIGVKSYRSYDEDWPDVKLHVRPDGVTVKFPGTPSWKISREEYSGWVLQVPADPEAAREALKREHLWRGAMAVGRRLDVRVRGTYTPLGGAGGGGPGRGAPGLGPIWTVLSLDCDIDVDSDRDGDVEAANYTPEADREDRLEDYTGNSVGALTSLDGRAKLIVRRLSAAVRPGGEATPEGRPLGELVEGSLRLVQLDERGEGAAAEVFPGRVTFVYEQGDRKLPALDRDFRLVPALWKKVVDGEDVELEMVGAATGRALVRAMLAVRRKGSKDEPVEFIDEVRVLVCGCEFVPCVDVNDRVTRDESGSVTQVEPRPGRGELPNIAANAVLPAELSGTGEVNRVRAALKVTAPPGRYEFRIDTSSDVNLSVPPRSRIVVEVSDDPAEGFTAFSNAGKPGDSEGTVAVTGGGRSSSAESAAFLMAYPRGRPPLPEDVIMIGVEQVVVYAFEFEIPDAESGTPTSYLANCIRTAGFRRPFDGDLTVGSTQDDGTFRGLDYVSGFEVSAPWIDGIQCFNLAHPWGVESQLTWTEGGGSTLVAYRRSRPTRGTFLYSRSSPAYHLLQLSLTGPARVDEPAGEYGSRLESGDMGEKLVIHRGTFLVATDDKGFRRLAFKEGPNLEVERSAQGATYRIKPTIACGRFAGLPVESHLGHSAAAAQLRTNPPGRVVYSGKASCELEVARKGKWWLFLYSPVNRTALVCTIGSVLPLTYRGANFGELLAQSSFPANSGETYGAALTNLTFGISKGEQSVDTATGKLKRIVEDAVASSPSLDQPSGKALVADGTAYSEQKHLKSGPVDMLAKFDEPLVFRVQTRTKAATRIPIWTTSTASVKKLARRGEGYAALELGPVEVRARGQRFRIWTLEQQEKKR